MPLKRTNTYIQKRNARYGLDQGKSSLEQFSLMFSAFELTCVLRCKTSGTDLCQSIGRPSVHRSGEYGSIISALPKARAVQLPERGWREVSRRSSLFERIVLDSKAPYPRTGLQYVTVPPLRNLKTLSVQVEHFREAFNLFDTDGSGFDCLGFDLVSHLLINASQ